MAGKKKEVYVSHAVPTKISAVSRIALKCGDTYYTVEASEERQITSTDGIDMDMEHKLLFDAVNDVVDTQVEDILASFKNNKK